MSFRNKVRARHYALGQKAKSAGLKELAKFQNRTVRQPIPTPKKGETWPKDHK